MCVCVCVCVLSHVPSLQVHGRSPPGSSAHVVLQGRILDGLPFPPPQDLPDPGIKPVSLLSPALAGRFFSTVSPGIASSNTHTHTHTSRSVITKFEHTLKFQRKHTGQSKNQAQTDEQCQDHIRPHTMHLRVQRETSPSFLSLNENKGKDIYQPGMLVVGRLE